MSKKTAKKKNVMVEENKVDKLLTTVFGDPQKKILRRLQRKVDEINDLSEKYEKMSDEKLKETFEKLKKSLSKKDLDDILPDVFALVREASTRVLGMRHFDVQLIGGMVLHEGKVAEMKTGEGKTLVATLPVSLNAMEGKGVHVVTVNDYLAQRDASWMGKLYDFLGLSVGVIINDASFIFDPEYDNEEHEDENMRKLRPATRKEAYAADITYGTNNEFGFDYLRDNMVNEVDLLRQRELNFAIVDEVDSILIDEARTPLIISAPAAENPESYIQFAQVISQLSKDDYEVDEKRRSVALTESGIDKIEKLLNMKNLYTPEHSRAVYHVEQALRAETLFKRDKDYVVTNDGEVIIVDEHTGRLMNGRRYNEGLHQAIEAKEKVPVLQESMTLATISFQNFFRLYNKLSGMTGTAFTEAEEFQQIYSLEVVQIPSNKPVIRDDKEDLIFKTEKAKLKAVAEAIKEYHAQGRPVLVGSGSIEKNEQIAKYLDQVSDAHLSDDTKEKVRDMLREIAEIESIGDSCFNIARTISRLRSSKEEFTENQYDNIKHMFELTDDALSQMSVVLIKHKREVDVNRTFAIESDINNYRALLRTQNINDINEHKYSYTAGTLYMDIIQECEKLGDYIVNVVEARMGVRQQDA